MRRKVPCIIRFVMYKSNGPRGKKKKEEEAQKQKRNSGKVLIKLDIEIKRVKVGVMNGPLKFLTARKILPLLDLLAKFKRVLACSCSPNFCVARQLAKQIFYFCSCSQKIAVLGMLANARKDHSSPLKAMEPLLLSSVS